MSTQNRISGGRSLSISDSFKSLSGRSIVNSIKILSAATLVIVVAFVGGRTAWRFYNSRSQNKAIKKLNNIM